MVKPLPRNSKVYLGSTVPPTLTSLLIAYASMPALESLIASTKSSIVVIPVDKSTVVVTLLVPLKSVNVRLPVRLALVVLT